MRLNKGMTVGFMLLSGLFASAAVVSEPSASAEGAMLYIVSPASGATVSSPVTVVFGLKGMGVAPAGIPMANTGHHHLLINGEKMLDLTAPLGTEVTHFGAGQTETTLTLAPGAYTLQLILGDHMHIPHNPPLLSEQITITVE
jgi:hypothetical protein